MLIVYKAYVACSSIFVTIYVLIQTCPHSFGNDAKADNHNSKKIAYVMQYTKCGDQISCMSWL